MAKDKTWIVNIGDGPEKVQARTMDEAVRLVLPATVDVPAEVTATAWPVGPMGEPLVRSRTVRYAVTARVVIGVVPVPDAPAE